MNPLPDGRPALPSRYIGWCVLAAGLTQIPALSVAFGMAEVLPGLAKALALISGPATLFLVVGGIGLILSRFFGYYFLYLATFFGGIGGLKISYVPFIQHRIKLGPQTSDLFLFLNLLIVAVVVWEHLTRLYELEPARQLRHRIATYALLGLGIVAVGAGRSFEDHERGEIPALSGLPVAGPLLGEMSETSPVRFVSVHTRLQNGITAVFSGTAPVEAVRAFATRHSLVLMTNPVAYTKAFPQTKNWRLKTNEFPRPVSTNDLLYVGRIGSNGKVLLQFGYTPQDQRYIGEVMGLVRNE